MIGQTLSHFKITAKLGEGGMGEVYLAEDTKLGREVAVKVLPEAFVQDAARMARFEREAKILASLNHPNIAGIHHIESVDDTTFLVMELVPGEDPGLEAPPSSQAPAQQDRWTRQTIQDRRGVPARQGLY